MSSEEGVSESRGGKETRGLGEGRTWCAKAKKG